MFKKTIFFIFGLLVATCALVGSARAATLTAGPLAISYDGDGPVFSELNIAPGSEYVRQLAVTNNGSVTHSFAIATANVVGELSNYIYLEPEIYGVQLWSISVDDLSNLPAGSQTILPAIDPGQTLALNLKARFDQNAGLDLANKLVSFDIIFGTQETEPGTAVSVAGLTGGSAPPPLATPIPTATSTQSPEAGEVLGAKSQQGESSSGLNGLLLLIPPAVLVLSIPFISPGTRNVILPTGGAAAAAVLAFFTKGSIPPTIFWTILVAELVLILILDYFIVKKTIEAVIEEEGILEKKARRAHAKKRR